LPKLFYFGNQFFPCHPVKVGVHEVLPPASLNPRRHVR
jgi:hypothetical protein